MRATLAETGFPTMRESGVRDEDVEQLAIRCREAWIPVEPGPWTHEDIVDACCDAWNWIIADTARVSSITARKWASVSI